MKRIIDWIIKHKISTFVICVLFFSFPLIVIQTLFSIKSTVDWFSPKWTAGELLAYIAGFEALLGTVILGLITVYQSYKSQEANEKLAKENNSLQKIATQRLLPLLKVESVCVNDSVVSKYIPTEKENIVKVSETATPQQRTFEILVYITPKKATEKAYKKKVTLSLKNISEGVIRQISIEKIAFSGFRIDNETVDMTVCMGDEKYSTISGLLLPNDILDVDIVINYSDIRYKRFWEKPDDFAIGNFDICLYLKNISISGIEYCEKIYIDKGVGFNTGFKEKIMYKAYEEEKNNADA